MFLLFVASRLEFLQAHHVMGEHGGGLYQLLLKIIVDGLKEGQAANEICPLREFRTDRHHPGSIGHNAHRARSKAPW